VAQEIRKLAVGASAATGEIDQLISEGRRQVDAMSGPPDDTAVSTRRVA